jgi:hypothetical protein
VKSILHVAVLLMVAGVLAGCRAPHRDLAAKNVELAGKENQVDRLRGRVSQLETRVQELEAQVKTLQGLGEKRLDVIFHPQRIELGRCIGIRNEDQEWDSGVRVYLRPIDDQGSTLKAAGEVKIQMYDLAAAQDEQSLGQCTYPAQDAGKYWVSAGFVNQYVFECRWEKKPAHNEVTVRAVFVDYLTGKSLTAQAVVKITPPAAGSKVQSQPAE